MWWLFGQVWLLCAVAFLLGSLVTWVLFVRPARRAAGTPDEDDFRPTSVWPAPAPEPPPVRASPVPPPPAVAAVDPALSRLDVRGGRPPRTSSLDSAGSTAATAGGGGTGDARTGGGSGAGAGQTDVGRKSSSSGVPAARRAGRTNSTQVTREPRRKATAHSSQT